MCVCMHLEVIELTRIGITGVLDDIGQRENLDESRFLRWWMDGLRNPVQGQPQDDQIQEEWFAL